MTLGVQYIDFSTLSNFLATNGVAMARHGPLLNDNETTDSGKVFKCLLGLRDTRGCFSSLSKISRVGVGTLPPTVQDKAILRRGLKLAPPPGRARIQIALKSLPQFHSFAMTADLWVHGDPQARGRISTLGLREAGFLIRRPPLGTTRL